MPRKRKDSAKVVRSGYEAKVGHVLSPKAIAVLLDFQKHYDLGLAFKNVGFEDHEAALVMDEADFRKEVVSAQEHSKGAVKYNKDFVWSEYLEALAKAKEAVDAGDSKAFNSYANLVKMGLETQGLTRKEDAIKAPSVTINFDLGGGEMRQVSGKVIDGESGKDGEA